MKGFESKRTLLPAERAGVLKILRDRFEKNMNRHAGLDWDRIQARLEAQPEKLRTNQINLP